MTSDTQASPSIVTYLLGRKVNGCDHFGSCCSKFQLPIVRCWSSEKPPASYRHGGRRAESCGWPAHLPSAALGACSSPGLALRGALVLVLGRYIVSMWYIVSYCLVNINIEIIDISRSRYLRRYHCRNQLALRLGLDYQDKSKHYHVTGSLYPSELQFILLAQLLNRCRFA